MKSAQKLNLLHLSDIHFRKGDNTGTATLNRDIREQMEIALAGLKGEIGPVHGILVSGDVAFRGDSSEYAEAHAWLTHLSGLVGCELQYIWTVPGNHDVDQTFIEAKPMLQTMQDSLSTGIDPDQVDHELNRQLSSRDLDAVIFGPLREYNQFASKFNCELSCARQYWEHSIKLNDGSDLCIRGLNSAIVSNKKDHIDTHKLVVGQSNCAIPQRNGVTYLAMCHLRRSPFVRPKSGLS